MFEEKLRGRRVVGLGLGARRLGILFDGRRLGWKAKAPKTRWTALWRGRAWGKYFREHGSNSNAISFVRSNKAGVVAVAAAAGRRQQLQQLQ